VAITIKYPNGGTAMTPARLPRQFVAYGSKLAAEVPVGVMMSMDSTTHKPNGQVEIGGTSIAYKKKSGGMLVEDPTRWAIHFRLIRTNHRHRFSLVVFDAMSFPPEGMQGAAAINTVRRDFLATHRRDRGAEKKDKRGIIFIPVFVNPASGTEMSADQFVAYGDLPAGDYDIDQGTKIVSSADHSTKVCDPDWSWSDGSSFWAAFFPSIDKTLYPKVDVQVVFKPSNDEDGSTEIILV
jgi:hypothetical protein